jgi:hypothetical protein
MGLHLWYLEILFVFTLLTFPLFMYLKQDRMRERISASASFFAKYGAIFLLGIPIYLTEWLVDWQPKGLGIRVFGGWSLFSYLVIFITGFLVASDARYREALERLRFVSAVSGLATTGLMFLFNVNLAHLGDAGYTLTVFIRAFNSWFWLAAILGFGSRHLNFGNKFLAYAREAVLPFYILHQTVIVVIGFYIADWETSVTVKYLTLCALAFMTTLAAYDLLVRRIKVLRFLFGMKAR